jgi:hypothetical protein
MLVARHAAGTEQGAHDLPERRQRRSEENEGAGEENEGAGACESTAHQASPVFWLRQRLG